MTTQTRHFVAFAGPDIIARGALPDVVRQCKKCFDADATRRIAMFDDATGQPVDADLGGSEAQVLARLASHPLTEPEARSNGATRKRPGRPRLGVVSREVSLLPRHWSWLSEQRGGASAALRRLVDEARKATTAEAQTRAAIDAAHRFMWDIAGDEAGFEDAARALFAQDFDVFNERTAAWPQGIRQQLGRYIQRARDGAPS